MPGMAADADDARKAELDAAFDYTFAHYALPGLAVGVIEDGKVVYLRTAGELEAGKGEAVTPDTLFKIASNSKAMTTGVLARLVDQGRLKWDDPVTKYLPGFRMHDDWVTANFQVRDLLLHNSGLGLGAGDLMLWPEPNDFTRADIIAGLRWLKPTHSFRSHYAYDNLLYVVAGEVAAAAGGKPYDVLVREQLFGPLGMGRCQVGSWRPARVGNVAQPHMRTAAGNVPIREDGDVVPDIASMPAGGIRCSINDMLTWVGMWLDPKSTWLSQAQRRVVWALQMPMPISQRAREWDNTHMYGYGFGWRIADVDGQWKVAHTGTLAGMYSSVAMLPDRRNGFVILTNGEGEAARTVLGEALIKRWTEPQAHRDAAYYAGLLDREDAARPASSRKPDTSSRVPASTRDLAGWQGVYRDPWFGEVRICPEPDGGVRFASRRSPMLRGRVMKLGTRWLVDWDEDSVDAEPWLAFKRDAHARTTTLAMAAIDPDADFSYDYADLAFTRVAACDAY